jgi:uncharacterized membrane protein YeiB
VLSALLVAALQPPRSGLTREEIVWLVGTNSMPPLPLFLAAAGGAAVSVLCVSLFLAVRFGETFPMRALVACGQMAFTWYILHAVGLGLLMELQLDGRGTLPVAVAAAAGFFAAISLVSLVLRTRQHRGLMEGLMRRIAG